MKRFSKRIFTSVTLLWLMLCSSGALHAAPPVYIGGLDFLTIVEDSGTLTGNLNSAFTDTDSSGILTFTISPVAPAGLLTINQFGGGGAFSTIVPNADQFGPFSFTVTATDTDGEFTTHTVPGEVIAVPDAPQITSPIPLMSLTEDQGVIAPIFLNNHFIDVDGDVLNFFVDTESNPGIVNVSISSGLLQLSTVAEAHGSTNIRICADDGVHAAVCTDLGVVVAAVNDAPVLVGSLGSITTPEDTPGTLGIDLTTIFADIDSTLFYTLTPTPTGIVNAFTSGNDLQLTTLPDANGTVSLLVTASDGQSSVDNTLTIIVTPVNDAPVITAQLGTTFVAEDQLNVPSIDLADHFSDPDGETLTYSFTPTPTGVINASIAGGVLSLSTIAEVSGTTDIVITAVDGFSGLVTSTLTVDVQPVNDPPVKTASIGVITIDEDQVAPLPTFDLNNFFSDVDSPTLTYSLVSVIPNDVVNANISGSTLSFANILDQFGTATLLISASDGFSQAPAETVSVVVNPVNDAPVPNLPLPPLTFDEDTGAGIVSLANAFTDVDGDSLTYSVTSVSPADAVTSQITGSTLEVDAVLNEFGPVTLIIEAIDGGTVPATTTLSVNITPSEDPPLVLSPIPDIAILEDEPVDFITLNTIFDDPDGDTLTFAVSSVTPAGIAQIDVNAGELRILPNPDAHGTVISTVVATDPGGNSVSDTFILEIAPVNDAPFVIDPAPVSIEEDTNGVQTQDATAWFDDVDLPLDTLGYTLVSVTGDPVFVGNNASVSPAGIVTYELEPNQSGFADITVMVADSGGETAETTLRVIVNPVNDPPFEIAPLPLQTSLEDIGSPQFSLAGVFGDDDIGFTGDILTYTVSSGATSLLGNFSTSGDNLVLTQAPHEIGTATVEVTATDTAGEFATTLVTVEVTPVNDAPFANATAPELIQIEEDNPTALVPAGGLEIYFDDFDLTREGDSFTFNIVGGGTSPLFDSISLVGNQLELDPRLNAVGFHSVQVVATDQGGTGLSSPPVDIPLEVLLVIVEAQDDTFTINEGEADETAQIIDVLANDTPGDLPTLIISAGIDVNLGGDAGFFEGASESEPTTLRTSTGLDVTEPNGQIDIINGGTALRYVPKANFSGTDFFTYTLRDADGDTSSARVDITIISDNDAPEGAVAPAYVMPQAGTLNVITEGGLLNGAFDPENDALEVIYVTAPDPTATLSFFPNADGSFQYTPLPSFSGDISFTIRYRETSTLGNLESSDVVVTISVAATPPPPSAPPAGEVEFDMNLSDVPLEDAISTEANVLVVMDDSGSMDWSLMTPESSGVVWLSNPRALRQNGVRFRSTVFRYILALPTNTLGGSILPVQAEIDQEAGPTGDFANNQFGVWRARSAQYNTIYYNPEIEYVPWQGLDRNNRDFGNVNPAAAPLDPFDSNVRTLNLTQPYSWVSTNVPVFRRLSTGRKTIVNNNVYLPYYWSTTATGLPEWNSPRTMVRIDGPGPLPGGFYPGGISRLDCAVDDGDPLNCTFTQELQNFANWFSYYRSREYVAKASLGRAVAETTNLRMGYAVLNDSNDRERIASLNSSFRSGHKADLLEQIYTTNSGGSTPLRRALSRAGRHFECVAGDSFGSTGTTSPGSPACPILPQPEGQCQNNFTLLFSDGTWNGANSGIPSSDRQNTDSSASTNGAVNTAFDGGVFADSITGSLADVAMHFYERDLHPSLSNGVPTSARDVNLAPAGSFEQEDEVMHQHMKTFTVGFGVVGNFELSDLPSTGVNPDNGLPVINFTQPFNWGNPFTSSTAKIDDMLHAALNGRGQFLQANNPVLLAQAFQEAFEEFSDGSVSVSAVAFGSTRLREGTVEYRGFFNLRFNSGDLEAIELLDAVTGLPPLDPLVWSAADQIAGVDENTRNIFTYDRQALDGIPFRHSLLNADQQNMLSILEVGYLRGDQSFEEPLGPFRARESVLGDIVNSGPRSVGRPQGIRRDRAPFPLDQLYSSFVEANENRRRVVYVGANDGMLHAFDAGFEDRTPIENGTGNELFAFVPNKLIDSTQRFNNDLDQLASLVYSHRFFVDLTPTVEDVFIRPNGNGAKEWRTLLVGGLRGGGKGYFALDITDPEFIAASETNGAQSVLWEFTDADDSYPVDLNGVPEGGAVGALTDRAGLPITDLGYTYSEARIAITNVDSTGAPSRKKWAVIFGNGYNSTAGIAKLFVLFVDDGVNGWQNGDFVKVNTGNGTIGTNPSNPALDDPTAGIPNGLGQPTLIDTNLDGVVDVAYAGDLQGHLYRFEIGDSDPSNWQAVKLFTATFNGSTATRQPITTAPVVTKHPTQEGFIVTFGTGSYITEEDGLSTDVQSVYGIWDRFEDAPQTAEPASKGSLLTEQSITNLVDEAGNFAQLRILTSNDVNYIPGNTSTSNYGWFIDLDPVRADTTIQGNPSGDTGGLAPPNPQYPGERAIRRIVPRGNALIITTVIPRDANSCFRAPPGSIFFIDSLTGGNPGEPIIDINNDGVIDSADLVTFGGEQFAAGILFEGGTNGDGSLVDPSVLLGDGDTDFLIINNSHSDLPQIVRVIKDGNRKVGRLSWWEITNE